MLAPVIRIRDFDALVRPISVPPGDPQPWDGRRLSSHIGEAAAVDVVDAEFVAVFDEFVIIRLGRTSTKSTKAFVDDRALDRRREDETVNFGTL